VYKPGLTANVKIHLTDIRRVLLATSEFIVCRFRLRLCSQNFVLYITYCEVQGAAGLSPSVVRVLIAGC
jgi:hypothetical protein